MLSHHQPRLIVLSIAVSVTLLSGILVGEAIAQTFTGSPGTALTNAVINFSALATNSPVSVPGTNLALSPPAITFEAQDDGGTQDPPFPGGAVGPNHVVSMLDNSIRIQKRDGTVISTITLQQFWGVLGPYVDPRGAFDGKVLYDPYKGRWITTAVADYDQPTSSTLVGVSQTSDPTGNWNLYRIAASTNGDFWVNYPSFGFNTNWIAVSVTAFPSVRPPKSPSSTFSTRLISTRAARVTTRNLNSAAWMNPLSVTCSCRPRPMTVRNPISTCWRKLTVTQVVMAICRCFLSLARWDRKSCRLDR